MLSTNAMLVVATLLLSSLTIWPSNAVLSGTGGVYDSPAAQEYWAKRFGASGALDAARAAGRAFRAQEEEKTNQVSDQPIEVAEKPVHYVPTFYTTTSRKPGSRSP